jgi:hypothetical protein
LTKAKLNLSSVYFKVGDKIIDIREKDSDNDLKKSLELFKAEGEEL